MRLIDADDFMKVLLKLKDINERCPLEKEQIEDKEVNNYDLGQKETFELVMEHLKKQNTAYDVDKVIKQLEEKKELAYSRYTVCRENTPASVYAKYQTQYGERKMCLRVVKSGFEH